jgi:His/Glu/Gln/Arg/opine family amino acid ABC transporter permease subunit
LTVELGLAYSGLQWSDLFFLLQGALKTLFLSVLTCFTGTIIGVALGAARESSRFVSALLAPYVDATRSVPLLIQFILFSSASSAFQLPLTPFEAGVLTLSLYMGVQTSELYRAGLRSVPEGLRKAARSLGMSALRTWLWVRAPLAIRTVFPAWIGTVIGLTKDTALVSVVGYIELLRSAQIIIDRTNEALLLLSGAGCFYFAICYPMSKYGQALERRLL